MATKRKVPMTKAGKPDKRHVKSVNAKSKAPTKRTKKRRAKPQLKGYSANPAPNIGKGFIIGITDESKKGSPVIGYFTGEGFDDNHHKAMFCPNIGIAKIVAKEAKKYMPKSGYKLAAIDYPLKKR